MTCIVLLLNTLTVLLLMYIVVLVKRNIKLTKELCIMCENLKAQKSLDLRVLDDRIEIAKFIRDTVDRKAFRDAQIKRIQDSIERARK